MGGDPETARAVRRKTMPVLLDRAQHGVLSPQEADVLRQYVAAEMRDADAAQAARATVDRLTAWCDELDDSARRIAGDDRVQHPVAANVRARITGPAEG